MIVNLSSGVKTSMLSQIVSHIDGGGATATIKFYTGSIPDNLGAVTDQVLLGTLTMSFPCGSIADNVLTMNPITQDSEADASGTASWVRVQDSLGVAIADFDVTSELGNGAVKMNNTSIISGGPITMTSFTVGI